MNAFTSGCWDGTLPSIFLFLSCSLLQASIYFIKNDPALTSPKRAFGDGCPPNTMESDSATTLVQDSTAIFAEDGLGRTPQRRSNRHASQLVSANIKLMYGVDEGGCKSQEP